MQNISHWLIKIDELFGGSIMNDFEILNCLKKNSEDEIVFKCTEELFHKELRGEYEWRSDYEKIISKYVVDEGDDDED